MSDRREERLRSGERVEAAGEAGESLTTITAHLLKELIGQTMEVDDDAGLDLGIGGELVRDESTAGEVHH